MQSVGYRSRGCKFESQLGHIAFMKIDHEIIFMVILSLLLILEGKLSVTDESSAQALVNRLED